MSWPTYADVYYHSAQDDLALPLLEETLRLRRKVLPANDRKTTDSILGLASGYLSVDKPDLAVPLLEEGIERCTANLGPDSAGTLQSRHNLAMAWECRENAMRLWRFIKKFLSGETRSLALPRRHAGESTGTRDAYRASRQFELASPLYEESLRLQTETLGADHEDTIQSLNQLAVFYWERKRLDKSIPLFEEAVRRSEAKWGRDHLQTMTALANLGVNYKSAGRVKEGLPLLQAGWQSA